MKLEIYYKVSGIRPWLIENVYCITRDYHDQTVCIEYLDRNGDARVDEINTDVLESLEVVF